MQTRVLGGEAGRRGFFGGSHSKARTTGLIAVAIVGAVLTIALGGVGLVVTVLVAATVYLATMRTHRGSALGRWQARRRWKERLRTGTVDFAPVATRPADLEPAGGSGKRPAAAGPAWAIYRDWPDGAEGMHWLARDGGKPGVLWHVPTGEPAYLSVAFRIDGQIRGVESDRFLDAALTAIGELLARYGSPSALPNRVQFLTHVLPVDSAVHEDWVDGELDAHAAEELVASYDEVVGLVSGSGLMQRHYVVIRWPITPTFRTTAARRGPAQAGWRALMAAEIEAVRSHLISAKLGRVTALSAAQLAAMLRHLQQPSWPIDQLTGVDVDVPWLPSHDELSATITSGLNPAGQPERWWHRTALIPIDAVETGPRTSLWIAPLLSRMPHPIVRTISLQTEVVPAIDARHAARMDVATDLADLEAQRERGVLTREELTVGLSAARARLVDVSPGSGHHGAGWAGHLTVSAPSREELVDATTKITEAAGNAGIAALEWLDTQQAAAAACTWPLARGMRPIDTSAGSKVRGLLAGSGSREAI